jgi:hypothetical protein
MSYTFDLSGHQLRVTDGTDHTIILQMRQDGIGVNVKDDTIFRNYPDDVRVASEQLGDERTQAIYDGVQGDFWSWAKDCAERHGFETVYQDGRSGGWLVLPETTHLGAEQLLEPDEEDEALRERALACFFEIERTIEEDWRPQFFEQVKAVAAEPVTRHRLYVADGVDEMPVADPRSWDDNLDSRDLEQRLREIAAAASAPGKLTIMVETYELSRAVVTAAAELAKVEWFGPSEELMAGVGVSTVVKHVYEMTDDHSDERERAMAVLGPLEEAS